MKGPRHTRLFQIRHGQNKPAARPTLPNATNDAKANACRNNPFLDQMKRTIASRAITRGLAPVEPDAGSLIVYAAKHGETALDGDGKNSPFATALLNRIQTPPIRKYAGCSIWCATTC
jgi:uncharacterized caspase-like protein